MKETLYGRNPVYESLRAGRRHAARLLRAEGLRPSARLASIEDLCRQRAVPVQTVRREQLDRLAAAHQGLALETGAYPYASPEQILSRSESGAAPPFLLILDSLQDPQNLGTLLRTAEALGVHGVCIPGRDSARVTPAVVSASSGASEHLLIARVNLVKFIREIKEREVWVVGMQPGQESREPEEIDLSGPIALVVGSEGQGLRRLVRESCDHLMRIPMSGRVESLNAAVAGSIALYLVDRTRRT